MKKKKEKVRLEKYLIKEMEVRAIYHEVMAKNFPEAVDFIGEDTIVGEKSLYNELIAAEPLREVVNINNLIEAFWKQNRKRRDK